MRKKILSALLCAAMVTTMVTGCGSKKEDTSDKGATSSSQSSEVSQDAKPAVTDETVSLTMWGAEEDQNFLKEVVDSFEADNPDQKFDIKIGVESESTAKDTILKDVEAAADVFAFADDQLNTLVQAGALQPVQSVDKISSENSQGSVEAATLDGTLYAYPYTADNGYFMFYNKKYFKDTDVEKLDDMLKIAADKGKQVAMDLSSAWYIYSFFGGAGLEATLADDGKTTVCNWNATDTDIKGTDVAQAMLDITGNKGFKSMTDTEIQTGFADGSVIAAVDGTWAAEKAEKAWGDDYAAAKLPTYTVAGKQTQMASFAGYKLVGVNAYSKNVGWAMELAKWLTNEQNQAQHFTERGIGPANINAAASDGVQKSPAINALIAQSEYANLQRVGEKYWDNVASFGAIMVDGNSKGTDLQKLLDNMVEGVTEVVSE